MHDRDALRELVRHMNWANHEMVGACASLSAEQLEREVTGIYGSVGRTLVHLARAQGGYVRALVGWDPEPSDTLSVDAPFPGVARVDAHLAIMSNRMNRVMKRMTSWGAIVLGSTLIAGIYGMNFEHMPELEWYLGYPLALSMMVVLTICLYWYFSKKDWL